MIRTCGLHFRGSSGSFRLCTPEHPGLSLSKTYGIVDYSCLRHNLPSFDASWS
jgi:hypothetical protein